MFQESEIINLLFGLTSILILILLFRYTWLPKRRYIRTGFAFILCAYVFTVAEGVALRELFNILEHASYALGGFFFALACWSILKVQNQIQKGSSE